MKEKSIEFDLTLTDREAAEQLREMMASSASHNPEPPPVVFTYVATGSLEPTPGDAARVFDGGEEDEHG